MTLSTAAAGPCSAWGGALILSATLLPARSFAQPSGGKSRIGIIGSGHIGGTIGGLWVKARHPVMFSSRHPDELKDMVAGRDNAAALKGKVVLDACNATAARDGAIAEEVERDGIGVTSQKYLAGTRLVRGFNTMSYMTFAKEANRPDPRLAIPIAGDDAEAVQIVSGLVRDAGFDPVVVGKLADAKRFQRGGPGYGQPVSAAELKQKLNLAP